MTSPVPPYNTNSLGYGDYQFSDMEDGEISDEPSSMEEGEVQDSGLSSIEEDEETDPGIEALVALFWDRFEELRQNGSQQELVRLALEKKFDLQGEVNFDDLLEEELEKAEKPEEFARIGTFALMGSILNEGRDFPRLVEALCNLMTGNNISAIAILSSLEDPIGKIDIRIRQFQDVSPLLANYFSYLKLFYLYGRLQIGSEFNLNHLKV